MVPGWYIRHSPNGPRVGISHRFTLSGGYFSRFTLSGGLCLFLACFGEVYALFLACFGEVLVPFCTVLIRNVS